MLILLLVIVGIGPLSKILAVNANHCTWFRGSWYEFWYASILGQISTRVVPMSYGDMLVPAPTSILTLLLIFANTPWIRGLKGLDCKLISNNSGPQEGLKINLDVILQYWNMEEMVFCNQKCSDLLWEKNVLGIKKNFWNSRLKAKNLQNFWDH